MNQRYIITGAPGTGKTSVITELKKRGFYCVNENSREIITQQIKSRGKILPWKNQGAFEKQVARKRLKQYLSSPSDCVCFFDRSIIDSIAYLKLNNIVPSNEIIKNIKKCSFNKNVFYTPIWKEIYRNDSERKENIYQAIDIEEALLSTYQKKKYDLIKIPKLSVKERTDFIISKI